MKNNEIYLTVELSENCVMLGSIKPGDILTLRKNPNSCYDDEAIDAFDKNDIKAGEVGNSVEHVARGTYSAGRVYDKIGDEQRAETLFIIDEWVIVRLI